MTLNNLCLCNLILYNIDQYFNNLCLCNPLQIHIWYLQYQDKVLTLCILQGGLLAILTTMQRKYKICKFPYSNLNKCQSVQMSNYYLTRSNLKLQ